MSRALGLEGKPGSVSILPARVYKKPAPTEARMSVMGKVYPEGRPRIVGSWEMDRCVLAMHMGKAPQPWDSK